MDRCSGSTRTIKCFDFTDRLRVKYYPNRTPYQTWKSPILPRDVFVGCVDLCGVWGAGGEGVGACGYGGGGGVDLGVGLGW